MRIAALLAVFALVACSGEADIGNDEPADYEVAPDDGKGDGVSPVFNQHDIVGDDVFNGMMTVADVQAFLEDSPYGSRSWLADYRDAQGASAARLIVDAASAERVSPLVLVSRMQVESSLVSRTARPTQYRIDRALGCGCPDGGGCAASYRGFGPQLVCAAKVLRQWYDGSVAGTGIVVKGKSYRTLDPRTVTPVNHATATLYAYTPWVSQGTGGNWLVWNVTRKYVRHAEAMGLSF